MRPHGTGAREDDLLLFGFSACVGPQPFSETMPSLGTLPHLEKASSWGHGRVIEQLRKFKPTWDSSSESLVPVHIRSGLEFGGQENIKHISVGQFVLTGFRGMEGLWI